MSEHFAKPNKQRVVSVPPIVLSGTVYDGYPKDRPALGDIVVYGILDRRGKANRGNRQANLGYSGYCVATVWTGRNWNPFTLWNVIPWQILRYRTERDHRGRIRRVIPLLGELRGRKAFLMTW